MNLMGADFDTPHKFKAGDTISAEMINELFEYIKQKNKIFNSNDFVGNWNCLAIELGASLANLNGVITEGNNLNVGWRNDIVTFTNNGNGNYGWSTANYDIFKGSNTGGSSDNSPHTGNYFVKRNIMFMEYTSKSHFLVFLLSKNSSSSVNLSDPDRISHVQCDKLNLTPKSPQSLTYALPEDNSSSSITLTWTDNQTGAITGYKVNRKTVITDNFTTVSTITDNTTRTYADDNVTESGKYWYRVLAYNSNGDGTPSKVVQVEFPDDQAPTGTLKIDNATASTITSSVTLNMTASDNKGVVGYLASESSAPPSVDSSSWVSITSTKSYSADVSFTLSSGYGVKFVYVWYKDGKGNIAGYGASITYSSE